MYPPLPLVIAHRGASAYRPENTLAAYALAVDQRADMIEIDLHETRDGHIAVAHDAALERLGGRGEIGDATLSELRALDAGGGEPVPSLDEVLDRFGPLLPFNLELKQRSDGPYPQLVEKALAAVDRRGLLDRMLFSSFYDPLLAELRDRSPKAHIGLLVSRRFPHGWLERARRVGAEALHPELAITTPALVEEVHAAGLRVHVFTVNEREDMERLLDWGVDGCFSDHPDRLRELVDRRGG